MKKKIIWASDVWGIYTRCGIEEVKKILKEYDYVFSELRGIKIPAQEYFERIFIPLREKDEKECDGRG